MSGMKMRLDESVLVQFALGMAPADAHYLGHKRLKSLYSSLVVAVSERAQPATEADGRWTGREPASGV